MNLNYNNKCFFKAMSQVWLIVTVMLFTLTATSCSDDDENTDGNYIITDPVKTVGVTYAELSGQFYPDRLPSAYVSSGQSVQVGMEISTSERFEINNRLSGYVPEIQQNSFVATAYGLAPNTQYYVRAFVELGPNRLYGENQMFTTQQLELPCSVGDATNVTYDTANIEVAFSAQTSLSPIEDISYGMAYSTNKDLLTNTSGMLDYNDLESGAIKLFPLSYTGQSEVISLASLEAKTTYYYCAYVVAGTYYEETPSQFACQFGPLKSFTTESKDGLLCIDAINAKFILAEVSGTTNLANFHSGLTYKLVYEKADDEWSFRMDETMNVENNKLSAVIRGLSPGEKYQCWIAAMKDGRTILESEKQIFSTDNPGDYIILDDATDVTSTSATINCRLLGEGYESEQWCYIYYGQDKNNLLHLETARPNGDHFSVTLTGLQPNTTYYYNGSALCHLSFGYADWFYSEVKSFTTKPATE